VGGIGPTLTLPLAARFADVWNVPTYGLAGWQATRHLLDEECESMGRDPAEVATSLEAVCVIAPDEAGLATARQETARRYGSAGWGLDAGGFVGTPPMIVERIHALGAEGVSLFVFFTHDRASPRTIDLFAEQVLPHLR
jgi:alkanesulfonate monooxygenase SsuD/methylene tetrahydromethanopterin reductase-like flavin-dependent oxidoreductase (luciferase family)